MATLRQKLERCGKILALGSLLAASLALPVQAQEKNGGNSAEPAVYSEMKPAFVVNIGSDNPGGRLSFAKVEVTLRSTSAEAAAKADKHMPALRHAVVMTLSKQSVETISSADGQETVRLETLKAIQDILQQEEKDPAIKDLLFTTFIVQR